MENNPKITLSLEIAEENNIAVDDGGTDYTRHFEMQRLTEAEQELVREFSVKIDLRNIPQILRYGESAQKKIGAFSTDLLKSAKWQGMGEVGQLIGSLTSELRAFDPSAKEKGLRGLMRRSKNRIEDMRLKYESAENTVNRIIASLDRHRVILFGDIMTLDAMYDTNMEYYKELTMYILAGRKKLRTVMDGELAELSNKAQETGAQEDLQAVNDLVTMCHNFEKKLYDLDLTRNISIQMGPQIRLLQNANTALMEKIMSSINNTIPLWKNQMIIALGMANSQETLEAQRKVNESTNLLLRKNADKLNVATVEVAEESERGIIAIETLRYTNESLLSTLGEVMDIQRDGRAKRVEAEAQLQGIENNIKSKLLQINSVKG